MSSPAESGGIGPHTVRREPGSNRTQEPSWITLHGYRHLTWITAEAVHPNHYPLREAHLCVCIARVAEGTIPKPCGSCGFQNRPWDLPGLLPMLRGVRRSRTPHLAVRTAFETAPRTSEVHTPSSVPVHPRAGAGLTFRLADGEVLETQTLRFATLSKRAQTPAWSTIHCHSVLLSTDCLVERERPLDFCPGACVACRISSTERAGRTDRTRWPH